MVTVPAAVRVVPAARLCLARLQLSLLAGVRPCLVLLLLSGWPLLLLLLLGRLLLLLGRLLLLLVLHRCWRGAATREGRLLVAAGVAHNVVAVREERVGTCWSAHTPHAHT
jgi:hypothetical protein